MVIVDWGPFMFWPLLLGAVLFGHAFLTDLHLTPLPPPPGYERAVASLPIRYWVLVRAVQLGPDHKGQSYTSGMIVVSRHAEPHVLVHETMHQVWYADP